MELHLDRHDFWFLSVGLHETACEDLLDSGYLAGDKTCNFLLPRRGGTDKYQRSVDIIPFPYLGQLTTPHSLPFTPAQDPHHLLAAP
jgi:hypothetical protein